MHQPIGTLVNCQTCDRRILVERFLIGVSHTFTTVVNCWECLGSEQQQFAEDLYGVSSEDEA